MVTVQVRDRSPKHIISALLKAHAGARDFDGMWAVMAGWHNTSWLHELSEGPKPVTFGAYCRAQSWTLAQVLALLEWQCCYVFGAGIDESEYNTLWQIFRDIVKQQNLLDITEAERALLALEAPTPRTRAHYIEKTTGEHHGQERSVG